MTLEGWNYRKSHIITHPTGGLTNYQTKIRVYRTTGTDSGDTVYVGDKCLADFGDIRFTNSTGVELDYWMETNAGSYADFWVELDTVGTTTTIYIYYGNSSATTTSNGDTTFIFFDDFAGSSLNTSKWTSSGSITVSNGICSVPTGEAYIKSKTASYGIGYIFESLCSMPSMPYSVSSKYNFCGFSDAHHTIFFVYKGTKYVECFNGSDTLIGSTYTVDSYTRKKIESISATSAKFYENDTLLNHVTTTNPTTSLPVKFINGGSSGNVVYINWVFVRTYDANDVVHSTWGAEQDLLATSFTIRITPTSGTDPLSVTYNCTIPEGTLTNFTLSYGDGQEYTSASQTSFQTSHTYDTPGTYTVWGEGYTEFATHVYYEIPYGVTVTAPSVVASFTISQSYNTIIFTNTSTGNINECYWDFGDGSHSYETNPTHTYYTTGSYTPTLYTSNQYQYSSATGNVTITQILTPPSAYFTPARLDIINPTLPYSVTFTNLSTPSFGCAYNWTVDGGSVSTSENPSISFATHGVYDIGLTVTNALGSSSRVYNDAIRLTRKSRTMNEVVGSADTFATFGCHVFVEYPSGSDLPLVYATILPEGVYFIQREIPDVPGIDEWGVRHLYSTINEWGIKIFNTINSWGHKILHNSSSVDRTPLRCIDVEIFEETVIVSDDHQFDEDPS